MIPTVSIVGKSKCGKTVLIEKLIPELQKRNYKVATIKHDAHGFDIDHPGRDTWRHSQAGSDCVTISSPSGIAMIRKTDHEWTLDQLIELNSDADIIITEGYRMSNKPKVEIVRGARSTEPICLAEELIALVTDTELVLEGVPTFHIDDVVSIADIIERKIIKNQ